MAYLKTKEEIEFLKQGGKKLGEILETVSNMVEPGISTLELDAQAEKMIVAAGGRPAFKGYRGSKYDPKFPGTICASVNEEVVHGIPSKDTILKEGDIFSIDIGMQWPLNSGVGTKGNGLFTDTALTVPVGKVHEKATQLLSVTKKSMNIGIDAMNIGGTIADIGDAIETYIKPQGYGIVRDLVGHGVGHAVHEEPRVPNYYDAELEDWEIKPGVVIAIEPMITIGDHRVHVKEDGWTIVTADRTLSAHFEHTIVVTQEGIDVVTRRPNE